MTIKTYDPANVVLAVGGVNISGYIDDTMVVIERDEDRDHRRPWCIDRCWSKGLLCHCPLERDRQGASDRD